jgi:hypothetical protein
MTMNEENSWVSIDIGEARSLLVNYYSLRHGSGGGQKRLRSWDFEGSNDGSAWTVLREHYNENECPDDCAYEEKAYEVKHANQAYRHFRIRMTGTNSNDWSNTHVLSCAGIELWGRLLSGKEKKLAEEEQAIETTSDENIGSSTKEGGGEEEQEDDGQLGRQTNALEFDTGSSDDGGGGDGDVVDGDVDDMDELMGQFIHHDLDLRDIREVTAAGTNITIEVNDGSTVKLRSASEEVARIWVTEIKQVVSDSKEDMGCISSEQNPVVLKAASKPLTDITSSQFQKKPAVKYRQWDGNGTHFNMGLTLEEIEASLDRMLPWGSYTRDESRFLDGDGKCWNSGEINGYDLGEVVRDFLRANGFERLSIAEVLWSEGREGVGEATVFFSHIQRLPVKTALQTLREASEVYRKQMGVAPRFFIDYLCIRQAQKGDFDLQVVRDAIHSTPLLLVELDDARGTIGNAAPDYFNRSFCIFEVFAAAESSTQDGEQKVLVFGPAVKNPKTAPWLATKVSSYGYNIVNSREGQCRWPAEKEKIDAFIESTVGFEALDKLVGSAVANACIHGLTTAAAADPSQINIAAMVGVQAADLTDMQLQQFCAAGSHCCDEVRTIDLHNCSQIVNVECLRVFSELRHLKIEGCDRINIASFVVLQTACAKLMLDMGDFLLKHGRFEEALDYRMEELKTVQQAGSCSREREGGRAGGLEAGRPGGREGGRAGGREGGRERLCFLPSR